MSPNKVFTYNMYIQVYTRLKYMMPKYLELREKSLGLLVNK